MAVHPKAQAKFRQGLALHEKGQLDQAQRLYHDALNVDSQHAESIHHLGIIALQSSDSGMAIALIQQALVITPNHPAALNNLGMALEDNHQPVEALTAYDQALACDPKNIDASINRGNVLQTLKRWDEALASYETLIARAPNQPDAYNNRGNVLRAMKRYDQALKSFDQAIKLKPNFAQAWNNRAITLKELKEFDAALDSYNRAIAIHPAYAEAYSNRGLVLKELKQFESARQNFDQAITLNPRYAQAFGNRGGLFQELKQYESAYKDYDRALALQPSIQALQGKRLHMQMHLCQWQDFDSRVMTIATGLAHDAPMADPFTVLGILDSPTIQKKAAEITIHQDYPSNSSLGEMIVSTTKNKIRIGYFSADLRNHPVSYLMVELFEKHDRNKFEIYAFNIGQPTADTMQERVVRACDQFIEVGHCTDLDIAKQARALNIDIAVDLGGFTIDNRPGIFALRAAAIQLSYIGYLGTMGAPYYDYLIADQTLIPDAARLFYTEKILYLKSYQSNDSQRKISDRQFTRAELGLPETGFVFCCFNNNYKFTPETFDSWMRILQAVPTSVLFLYADQQLVQLNLKNEARARGIDPERLVFGTSLPREEYLARYQALDLFLDTLPYNAGTTASDALWAGLPVLTLAGQSLASRMAASVLTAIELPELITHNRTQYEALAVTLAQHPTHYQVIKEKLQHNIRTSILFNSDAFCTDIESHFIHIFTTQPARA